MKAYHNLKEFFNGYAQTFDNIYCTNVSYFNRLLNWTFRRSMFLRFQQTFLELADLRGKCILDVGCGSGRYSIECAKRGAAYVLGVDISSEMINIAKRLAVKNSVQHICEFRCIDFHALNRKKFFDHSIAIGLFDYLIDPTSSLQIINKLTRYTILVSFPKSTGILAFQRKLRYLYLRNITLELYSKRRIRELSQLSKVSLQKLLPIGRDYFVVFGALNVS